MCELLGMSANVPTDICFSFSGLVERGGNTGPHKDGWGITFYEGKGCRTFKDAAPSATSEIAALIKDYPIKSNTVISHIRQANSGDVSLVNTHPFIIPWQGHYFTYAHNGQLKDYQPHMPLGFFQPVGDTDSEYAFCYLLSQMAEHNYAQLQPQQLFKIIAQCCDHINQFGVFNILLTNGEWLFAYCSNNLHWLTRSAPFGKAELLDAEMSVNFKQETTLEDIVSVIATQPLTQNETWHKMTPKQWLVFEQGQVIASHLDLND